MLNVGNVGKLDDGDYGYYMLPWTIPPFFTFSTKNLPSFPMLSPCLKEQKLASGTKETPMLLSMAHTARLAACGGNEFFGKNRVKNPTKKWNMLVIVDKNLEKILKMEV